MFEVGFGEMVLVGVIALLVLGPERLPKVAREVAFWVRKAKTALASAKADINRELELDELRRSVADASKAKIELLNAPQTGATERAKAPDREAA